MFLLSILVIVSAVLIYGGRKTLKPLFHLLSVLLVLPSVLFAGACLVLQKATEHDSVFGFFEAILSFIAVMYPWGTVVLLACLITLLAAGFGARWRQVAAGTVVALAAGSAAVMHWVAGMPDDPGQWWFFVPGLLSMLIAGWLLFARRPGAREFALQYPGGLRIDQHLQEETLRTFQHQPGFERQPEDAAGRTWYRLPTFQDGTLQLGLRLGFQRGALQQIDLFHDDPALYGATPEAGPENKEHLRAGNTRVWLQAKGFPVGTYPWGEVWVGYDPRSDFGSGGIRFSPPINPRPEAVLSKSGLLPSASEVKLHSTILRLILIGGMVFASALNAQTPSPDQPTLFEQRLRGVRFDLRVERGGFGGAGAPVLEKAIAEARYVLIGEDHFTREIPQFTSAVCDLMGSQGLFALATEASPQAAAFVGETLDKPDRIERLAALLKKYPDCIAFLNSKQENDLAAHAAGAVRGSSFQLWGLDQDFLGSAGWLLDEILAQHPGPAATAALTRMQAEEQKDAAQARENGDPSKLLLFAVSDAELTDAGTLLLREGNAEANRLFHALVESHEIYLKNAQGSPDANSQRAHLLKKNFQQRLDAATASGQKGKVLVKLGDWHLYKGFNPLHERDLGNYLAELADGQGSASLHICVLGAKGRHALYNGYGQPFKVEPFVMDQDPNYHWIKPMLDNQVSNAWTLYDLRRLRSRDIGSVDSAISRLIDGYDLLIVIPEITPADPVQ